MKEIEIILIDDCSKDDTLNLVEKYMKEDQRIRLIKNEKNRKILYSKSLGVLNANGKYILQLDQDDLFIRDDLFDLLYNEAENNNLDLTQIRDIFTKKLNIEKKKMVNFYQGHFIYLTKNKSTIDTHYKTNDELKKTIFLDGCLFPLWGLLIKANIYKKAIYYLWPIIMNYEFIMYEDYLVSTIIVIFSKKYKYLNNFGLIHLNHKNASSNVYAKEFATSLVYVEIILYKYYIKFNQEDIQIIMNLIKRYKYIYKPFYKYFYKIFKQSIIQILSNKYLFEDDKNYMLREFEIDPIEFKTWNSYEHLMNSSEFYSLLNFQNFIINNKTKNNINEPKITIIIYCSENKYLENTINSIENQILEPLEIIIIYDNDDEKNLYLIQEYIKIYQNINLINNMKRKGILFSYSSAILLSHGEFILLLKPGETLVNENILNNIYNIAIENKTDILEFNLLVNNCDNIKNNSLSLYKCRHIDSSLNMNSFKHNKQYINIDQEKDILTNKIIKKSFVEKIIKKYKINEFKEIIYNYYDEIFLFLFSKERGIFKRINLNGVIRYITYLNVLDINSFINDNNQKKNDSIFYIDFLFEQTGNSFEDKKIALNEFYSLLSIIFNRFTEINDNSIDLINKFINSNFISKEDKNNLQFFYNSLIN